MADAVRRRVAVLEHPGFRRFLAGRAVSVLGDGLYAIASMWLVWELTGSSAYTGLAGFLAQAPGAFAALVGPLVDRARLRRVLALSEVAQGVVVLAVPAAALLGVLDAAVVLAVMPLLGLVNLFATPAGTATLPRIVPDDQLVRANSAFSVVTQAVDAAARAVAGAVVALLSAVAVYVVDAATFLVAAVLFASVSVPPRDSDPASLDGAAYLADLREGLGLLADSTLAPMVAASLFANFLVGVSLAVLPAFAEAIGGPTTYGLLLAAITVGRVVGSLGASAVDTLPMGRTTAAGFAVAGSLWVGAVVAPGVAATVLLFGASRVPIGIYNVSVRSVLQTGVPDGLLARVSAAIGSATSVVLPAGLLLGGLAGDAVGARTVMVAGGGGVVLAAGYWLADPRLRRFGPPTRVSADQFE